MILEHTPNRNFSLFYFFVKCSKFDQAIIGLDDFCFQDVFCYAAFLLHRSDVDRAKQSLILQFL